MGGGGVKKINVNVKNQFLSVGGLGGGSGIKVSEKKNINLKLFNFLS